MQNTSSRPDPSTLPVLTDVVELPFEPTPPPTPPPAPLPDPAPETELVSVATAALAEAAEKTALEDTVPAKDATQAEPPAPASPASADTALETIRLALLEDLKARIDPWLEQRVREHLSQAVEALTSSLTQSLHQELDQLLDEALNKELIQREAQLAQEKLRDKTEPMDPATT